MTENPTGRKPPTETSAPRPRDPWSPPCRAHKPALRMVPSKLLVHFPGGDIEADGVRCTACGAEKMRPSEMDRVQQEAKEKGLLNVRRD